MSKENFHRSYSTETVVSKGVDLQLLRRLFTYLLPYRWWMLLSLTLLLIAKLMEAILPLFIGNLAEMTLTILKADSDASWPASMLSYCEFVLALLSIGYLFDAVNVFVKNWIGQRALLRLRSEVFDRIQRMPIAFFDRQRVGRLMSRSIHDVEQINQLYSESLVPILGNALLLVGIGAGIFYLNWRVALTTLSVFPFLWWLTARFRITQRRCFQMVRAIISALNGFVQEQLSGATTVWSFGSHRRERRTFEEINNDHYTANIESIKNSALFFAGIDFFHQLVLAMIFGSLAAIATPGEPFQAAQFFTFSLYALMVFRPIADLAERYNVLQSAIASSERIFDIMDQRPEDLDAGEQLSTIEDIEFTNVWFAYAGEHWVLREVSFSLNKGQSIALVGMTGAGKTTVMSLLLRLYDVTRGQIHINGKDIRSYSLRSLRRQFSVVLQDPVLFSGSFADNIRFGVSSMTDEAVERAIDYVGLQPLVNRYQDKLQHIIQGGGVGLSSGERQLVSLTRAVAFNGSAFLLDEATAHIDTESERRIQNAMDKLLQDRTSLVIAHRLSTVQHVDRILVMHNGAIVENGTHKELISLNGIYEKLYRLQFAPE